MSATQQQVTLAPAGERRSAWIAGILSLLMPGLGHIYVGRAGRGVVLFAMALSAQGLIAQRILGGTGPRFWMLASLFAVWLLLVVFTLIEAAQIARATTDYVPKRYNSWYAYVGAFLIGSAINIAACAYVTDASASGHRSHFNAASSSMEPTLRNGETFLADTTYYRKHQPGRGEVAVYRHPKQADTSYVKRIVALPGERIALKDGRAIVNGTPLREPYANPGDPKAFLSTTREVTVPAGHVFVLGDNRANSMDSRSAANHGTVPIANLIARATDIAFTRDFSRIGRWIGTAE